MSRRGPFDDIERVFDRMNEELEELGRQMEGGGRREASADVVETDDAVVVTVELPGYEADEIGVSVDEGVLVVEADHEESAEATTEAGARYHRRERTRRGVTRRLRLPAAVRGREADAEYEHGVLTVTLPKETSGGGGTSIDVS